VRAFDFMLSEIVGVLSLALQPLRAICGWIKRPELEVYLEATGSTSWDMKQPQYPTETLYHLSNVVLRNHGRTPAQNVQIQIQFPQGFSKDLVFRHGGAAMEFRDGENEWKLSYSQHGGPALAEYRTAGPILRHIPFSTGTLLLKVRGDMSLNAEYEVIFAIAAQNFPAKTFVGRWSFAKLG
jgi:hypothetical protein